MPTRISSRARGPECGEREGSGIERDVVQGLHQPADCAESDYSRGGRISRCVAVALRSDSASAWRRCTVPSATSARPGDVAPAPGPYGAAVLPRERATQEGRRDLPRQLLALERCVALRGGCPRGA